MFASNDDRFVPLEVAAFTKRKNITSPTIIVLRSPQYLNKMAQRFSQEAAAECKSYYSVRRRAADGTEPLREQNHCDGQAVQRERERNNNRSDARLPIQKPS